MDPVSVPWLVPVDHPAFAGHFPGQPILPGVALVAEALEVWRASPLQGPHSGAMRVAQVKFLHPVRPGTSLMIVLEPLTGGAVRFTLRESDRVAATGSFEPISSGGVAGVGS